MAVNDDGNVLHARGRGGPASITGPQADYWDSHELELPLVIEAARLDRLS